MKERRKIPIGQCEISSRSRSSSSEALILVCSAMVERLICCCSRRCRNRAPKLWCMRGVPRRAATRAATDYPVGDREIAGGFCPVRRFSPRRLGRGGPPRRGAVNLLASQYHICEALQDYRLPDPYERRRQVTVEPT